MAKAWLQQRWEVLIPVLEALSVDQEDQIAKVCADEIEAWKARPTMKSLSSLKEPMSDTRNRIRQIPLADQNSYVNARSGEREHIALKYLNYTEEEWTEMNQPTEDRFHERLENQLVLQDSEAIISKACALLLSDRWPDIVVGLAVVTGRRLSEMMKVGVLHPKTSYSVMFSGQLKRKDQILKPYEIPVLVEARLVLDAWMRLRQMIDCTGMETEMIGKTYDKAIGEAANRHFSNLVPVRDHRESLFAHLFRDVYPCLAVFYFAPDHVHDIAYLPVILGHYWSKGQGEQQRNYQSSLRYLAYRISDAEVYKHKGKRQGVRLGEPGVEVLEVFQSRPEVFQKKKELKMDLLETKKKHSATQLTQQTKSRLDQVQKDLNVRTQDEAVAAVIDSYYVLRQMVQVLEPLYEQLGADHPLSTLQKLVSDEGVASLVDRKLMALWKTSLAEVVDLLEDAGSDSGEKLPIVYLREMLAAKRSFKKSYEKRHQGKDYSKISTSQLRNIKMPGAAEERFRRAVDTIIRHNETIGIPEFRRYVSPALVVDLVGGRPADAKTYIESRVDVDEHHTTYGIKPGINRIPLVSVKLEVPEWPEIQQEVEEEPTEMATEE